MRSRPFVVLYAAVIVATMGISMVSPLLPVFARDLGATGMWIGLMFSIFAVTQTIFGPFSGRLSDRYGRKPFIIGGLLLYFVAALGYLTAANFYQVLAFRALSGVGTSLIFSVSRAYIGDMVPARHEGRWFAVFATADVVGFGIGPLIAGLLRALFNFDAVFIGMAALMGSAATIVWLLLPPHGDAERLRRAGALQRNASFAQALRDRLVVGLTLIMGLVSLSWGATFSFLAVRLEDLGIGPIMIGIAFGAESLASGVSQPALGWAADRYDRRAVVSVGLVFTAALLFALGLAVRLPVIVLLLAGMGVGVAAVMSAGGAMQVVAGRRVGMGTVLGLGSAGQGAGVVTGSVLGGLLVDRFGLSAAFFFAGLVMLAGVACFLWLTRGAVIVEEDEPPPLPATAESPAS